MRWPSARPRCWLIALSHERAVLSRLLQRRRWPRHGVEPLFAKPATPTPARAAQRFALAASGILRITARRHPLRLEAEREAASLSGARQGVAPGSRCLRSFGSLGPFRAARAASGPKGALRRIGHATEGKAITCRSTSMCSWRARTSAGAGRGADEGIHRRSSRKAEARSARPSTGASRPSPSRSRRTARPTTRS